MNEYNINIDQCLTMAAFAGFIALREFLAEHPDFDINAAIDTICRVNSDFAGFDYIAGTIIHQVMPQNVLLQNDQIGLRAVITKLVELAEPWWLRLFPYGRAKVRSALNQNQQQCFREAGLFEPVPAPAVVTWWDEISGRIRNSSGMEQLKRGREAEQLSFDHECNRILALGLDLVPDWVALEDNTLGYDIKSYDVQDGRVINRMIEVKSAATNRIFISRNEWENALAAERQYCFHVWKMPEAELHELSVSMLQSHIPVDQGDGEWQNVQIEL